MSASQPEKLLTVKQVAALLGFSKQAVYRLTTDEKSLPCCKIGRYIRVSPSALARWVEAGGVSIEERQQSRSQI